MSNMKVLSPTDDLIARMAGFDVVENRFVERTKVYVIGQTIIAHPYVIDALHGYSKPRRWLRHILRELRWRFIQRPRARASIRNGEK